MDAFRFSPRPNRAHEVHWREWGPEALQEAQRMDRPVILGISAVWCHWCHVMDETTYSDPRVIELLNREFIPIRVDNDRRPEVNQRYNMGGWPTTAFLTPQGDILTGATFLPPQSLISTAEQIVQYYRTRKAELYSRILEQRTRAAPPPSVAPPSPGEVAPKVLSYLTRAYDSEYGGFGQEPKFPQADALELLLAQYQLSGEARWGQMAGQTLRAMASGGLFDHVAGGFFRYSTTRDWSIPHYEKMAEDNAALLRVLLHGALALGDPELARAAGRTVDYVLAYLYDTGTKAFYGSQDADEEYYRLPPVERARRDPPLVDRTVYTNWAAAMAAALLEASRVLSRPELEEIALGSLGFLWDNLYREGRGMGHYHDGQARGEGLLVDQVWMLTALLDAHEATGRALFLERAEILARLVINCYQDPAGGFYDTWQDYQPLGRLQEKDKGIAENALAAEGLARIFHLIGEEDYLKAAQGALLAFGSDYLRFGPYSAVYARAAGWLQEELLLVRIVGRPEATQAWRETAMGVYHPHLLVQSLDPSRDRRRLMELDLPAGGEPMAYICYRGSCAAPIERLEDLALAMLEASAPPARGA